MPSVNYIDPATGTVYALSPELAAVKAREGWVPETPEAQSDRTVAARVASDYDTLGDKFAGGAAALARGATANLSDPALRFLGVDANTLKNQRDAIGGWATPLEITGAIAPVLATGGAAAPEVAGGLAARTGLRAAAEYLPTTAISRLGSAITRGIAPEGAGLGAKVLGGALGAGTETALYNVGAAASEAALSDDPLTIDHLKGAISTGYLLGAPLGAGASLLEHGLAAGSRRLGRLRDEAAAAPTIADDLGTLDRKGLDVVKDAEHAAIEAARVPQRAQLGADIAAFRDELQASQPWVAVAQGGTLAEKEAAIKAAKKLRVAHTKAESEAARLEAEALAAETASTSVPAVEGAAAAAPAPRQSWKEFQASRMGEYMKSEGGHGGAMKRLGEEWKAYKAAEPVAVAAPALDHIALRAEAAAAREAADKALTEAVTAEARANALRAKAPPWMGKGSAVTAKSDMTLDRILDDPKALAGLAGNEQFRSKALAVQTALRKAETHYENILAHEGDLVKMYAHDTGGLAGTRAQAFASIPKALEKNRALQRQIDALIAAPSSPRLAAINDAITSYADRAKLTTAQKIGGAVAGGSAMSAVYAVGSAIPGVGFLAPLAGAAAAGAVIGKIGRTLGKTSVASLERSKRAVDALLSGARTVKRAVPPLASKVLAAFADAGKPSAPRRAAPTIQDHYEMAVARIAPMVQPGPAGKPVVRPAVRKNQIAPRLAPIAVYDSRLADQMETHAVRSIEFLADKMPKVTQLGMMRSLPSDAVIRAWARMVDAVNDPGAVEERVAHGTVTPEDREVMQALYPARYADYKRQIIERMDEVRKLPHQRRLALSIFTGVAIDSTMDPRILDALQAPFAAEPGTEGGTQAPVPRPAFGSVKKPDATPAQRRAG